MGRKCGVRCGVARRSEFGKTTQRSQCGEYLQAKQHTATRQICLDKRGNTANSARKKWAVLVGEASTAKMGQCLGGGLLSLSLSLSLSRCSHFLARLCVKFKGFFYSFHRSFFSSFCLQKAFFRTFCFFKIFKCFVFGLLCPFCHFERSALAQSEKSIRMLRYTLNLR